MIVKQAIIVRNDLRSKLRHGKLAAQVAHASMGAVFQNSVFMKIQDLRVHPADHTQQAHAKCIYTTPELITWLHDKFTKVVLRCDDEAHLLSLHKQAEDAGLMNALIRDAGHTVFNEPTYTCLGIGPATAEQLDPITSDLRMY